MFGGSFNPVHAGHIALCRGCQDKYRFDRFLMVPDNLPPHKPAEGLVSNESRLEMLRIALKGNLEFEISTIEYELGGRSYTVRTLAELKKRYPGYEFYLLIGSDMLFSFREWREYETILELAVVVAAARHPAEIERLQEYRRGFGLKQSRIEILELPVLEISSTHIRDILKEGRNPGDLLPPGVYDYIQRWGLYGVSGIC